MSGTARTSGYRPDELAADRVIHRIGIVLGAVGSVTLLRLAARTGAPATLWACLVYVVFLLAMLLCSAAYSLSTGSPRRALLRRLDHAAIFLMIAGTYTPFTICRLSGVWAIAMTAGVWAGAAAGGVIKLAAPQRIERGSVVLYLGLGWMIVAGARPLLASVDLRTAVLVALGGVLYSAGAGIYAWRGLRFHNAIWHGFVLLAAGCHYAAILHGVVLAPD